MTFHIEQLVHIKKSGRYASLAGRMAGDTALWKAWEYEDYPSSESGVFVVLYEWEVEPVTFTSADFYIGQKVLTYMGAIVTITEIYNAVATGRYADGHEGLFPLYTLRALKLWHGDTLFKFWAASYAQLMAQGA